MLYSSHCARSRPSVLRLRLECYRARTGESLPNTGNCNTTAAEIVNNSNIFLLVVFAGHELFAKFQIPTFHRQPWLQHIRFNRNHCKLVALAWENQREDLG